MDALEGLRRRQWDMDKEREQEREAYNSMYSSAEWTRQQYEEMEPLQDQDQDGARAGSKRRQRSQLVMTVLVESS